MHAAIIARSVLQAGGFKAPKLDAFMVQNPAHAAKANREAGKGIVDMLKTMAVRKKRPKK